MRPLVLLPALAAIGCVQAQQIDAYRYWFDDDVAAAVTTSVNPTDELHLVANWPTGALTPGYHRMSMQTRDTNGDWSVPRTSVFVRGNHAITGYRFWVNDDGGTLTTSTLSPGMDVQLNALIDPGTLPKDYNTVTIQFRDADGEWSAPTTSVFVKNTGEVNAYEYWIDDGIANSSTTGIGPNGVVDLIADVPTGTTSGTHTFTIRFSGTNGTWSVPLTTQFDFHTSLEELPGLNDLLLFPNPVTDALGVRLSTTEARQLDLQLLDAQGRLIRSLPSWAVNGQAHQNWDISDLSPGSYLLRIVDGQGSHSLPFVKQ